MYPYPRVFRGKQLINTRCQVGCSINLGISGYSTTRYLDVYPLTREDVKSLSFLHLACGESYSLYRSFVRSYIQFKLYDPCPITGKVNLVFTNKNIQ